MTVNMSAELQENVFLGQAMGDIMRGYAGNPNLRYDIKPDGSKVTEAEGRISEKVIEYFSTWGRPVVSEEGGGTAEYGDPDAEYLDPTDDTEALLAGGSTAAFSLGSAVGGELVRGVVNLPFTRPQHTYIAERGGGAYRLTGSEHTRQLHVDPDVRRGIVLVSPKNYPYIDYLEEHGRRLGIRPVRLSGAVFKACAVADPSLMQALPGMRINKGEEVIGFLSASTKAHDYAAVVPIVREAGGLACGIGPDLALPLGPGRHPSVFANSEATCDLLLHVLRNTMPVEVEQL